MEGQSQVGTQESKGSLKQCQSQVSLLYIEALPKTHLPSTQNPDPVFIAAFAFTAPHQRLCQASLDRTACWQACAAYNNSSNFWSLCRPRNKGSDSMLEYAQ